MTELETQIWNTVHNWCDAQTNEIPDQNRRYLMDEMKALILSHVSNCTNHQIRRCMHCNYKWAYHLYFAAHSNAAKCPNCGGLMTNIVDKF